MVDIVVLWDIMVSSGREERPQQDEGKGWIRNPCIEKLKRIIRGLNDI